MKITIKSVLTMGLEEFADKYNLEMEVVEREEPIGDFTRYYAFFKNCEMKNESILKATFGNGATPEEAILNYMKKIQFETLVYNQLGENNARVEINVPRLER